MINAMDGAPATGSAANYLDDAGRDDRLSGSVRRIPIQTSQGTFNVCTRRFGNNPRIKLLLHGGLGLTHEYFEPCDS